jgi:hypothetical protein
LGAGGALGGTWLTQRSTHKREREQWRRQRVEKLRDAQAQLYLDLMEFMEDNSPVWDQSDQDGPEPVRDLKKEALLTARVHLYADDLIRHEWWAAKVALRPENRRHDFLEDPAYRAFVTLRDHLRAAVLQIDR